MGPGKAPVVDAPKNLDSIHNVVLVPTTSHGAYARMSRYAMSLWRLQLPRHHAVHGAFYATSQAVHGNFYATGQVAPCRFGAAATATKAVS